MFPSREKARQLMEQTEALINGAIVKLDLLTLPMVVCIEDHVLRQGGVVCTTTFNARRVDDKVLWSFFTDMMVHGIMIERNDTVTSLGSRLRLVPRTHAMRGYSICEGPLVDYLVCIRRSEMAAPRHRVEKRDSLYVYHPTMPEDMVFRNEKASRAVMLCGEYRALACATSITKN